MGDYLDLPHYVIIFKTSNGGNKWSKQNTPSNDVLYSVFFIDNITGWAFGHLGTLVDRLILVQVELISLDSDLDKNNINVLRQTATKTNN